MDDARQIALAVDRAVSRIGLGQVLEITGIPRSTVQNWTRGLCVPPTTGLLRLVRACDEAGHPEAGSTLLDAVLATVGRESRLAPVVCPERPAALLAMHASAETGDVLRWAEDALRDGVIDHIEGAQGEKEIREASHALDQLAAVARGAALRSPQRALALGVAR